ncbi:porin [Marivita hallyeonensis]|uniref:Outer membrane protein OmpU n=1 Tax=Marivita hallyeonensis TaxID=996342 RepID=A0A1M5M422_9RHOB|nr:porin [Marivita hallyeonensis]SHG71980.1 outer membrane protein OmpU [Marivita hallyeonensis]
MKKLLLASTALVATAGIAAADDPSHVGAPGAGNISITGYAEIGVIGGDRYGDEAQFHTDIDVTFSMTGESDGGLAFGASVDLDEAVKANTFDATKQGGEVYFLAYGPLRLDMGDTDGAYDAALQEVALAGASIADDETEHSGYNGNSGLDGTHDGQIARVSYSMAGFTAGLSAEIDDSGVDDPVWGLGLRYVTDFGGTAIGIGLGYQTVDRDVLADVDLMAISLDATFANGFRAAINYAEADIEGQSDNGTFIGVGVGYTMNALSIGVNYGEYEDWAVNVGAEDASGFGIAATYDLGGGLAAHVGYGSSDDVDGIGANDEDSYSFGLSMSF